MAITDWPKSERPREKLLERGARSLSDAELLAIFLRSGPPGSTAFDLALELLQRFGGLRPLLDATEARICVARGFGRAKHAELRACLEMGRRYLEAALVRGETLTGPKDTRDYLTSRLRGYQHEVFACLFLDGRHRLIGFEELFQGTIDGASVHPRVVVTRALSVNAAAVILAHNHPSGVAQPSDADRALTRRLQDALALVDIKVLDHFVIGDGESASFAERGLL